MKKVLLMLLMGVMVLGAKFAFADARLDSLQGDARLIDDVDLIFLGYADKVVDYKNMADFRLNNAGGNFGDGDSEWGGVIDGEHTSLGVFGVYVNRPFGEANYNTAGTSAWLPTGGSSNWTQTISSVWNYEQGGNLENELDLAQNLQTPNNKVDLFWATSSDSANFGIGLNYADNQAPQNAYNEVETGTPVPANSAGTFTYTNYARVLGINVGLGLKNTGFDELHIHAGYSYGTFEDSNLNSNISGDPYVENESMKDNGIYTITLGALAQSSLDKDSNVRMFVDANLNQLNATGFDQEYDYTAGLHTAGSYDEEVSSDFSSFGLQAGLGCNHKVNDGAAVVSSGLVFNYGSSTSKLNDTIQQDTNAIYTNENGENDYSTLSFIWNGSVDAKVASWLNLRAGISEHVFDRDSFKYIQNNYANGGTTSTGSNTTSYNGDDFAGGTNFSVGFGIHWQNWTLDGDVSAGSFERTIANVQPGNGLLYFNGNSIVTTSEADLRYNF